MELNSFSSIFEIFATLTLAYILIDELLPNPFISLITEKVLRRYSVIDRMYAGIKNQITGRSTSLNNLAQKILEVPAIKDNLPTIQNILDSTEERTQQSFSEIKTIIRSDYQTKIFAFLNCYLFLFCITILFIGGIYIRIPCIK